MSADRPETGSLPTTATAKRLEAGKGNLSLRILALTLGILGALKLVDDQYNGGQWQKDILSVFPRVGLDTSPPLGASIDATRESLIGQYDATQTAEAEIESLLPRPTQRVITVTPQPTNTTEPSLTPTSKRTETKTPIPTNTEVPLPQVWSPELSQQEQKDYLDHLLSETKIDPAAPLGIYRYGSIEQSDELLKKSPVVSAMDEYVTGNVGDNPIVSGILLPASTNGDLIRYAPEVNWYGYIKAQDVPYYLLAVPINAQDNKADKWIILQVLKVGQQCERIVVINSSGEGGFVDEDSISYLKPGQVQVELLLEGMTVRPQCLSFTPEQVESDKLVWGLARKANPQFWDMIEQVVAGEEDVTYLDTDYSTHAGIVYQENK